MTKVLVVEDEQGLREPLVYLLEREGYSVVEASDGLEALKVFKTSHPDLILLDLMLPGMSGNEVCREIRSSSNVSSSWRGSSSIQRNRIWFIGYGLHWF